MEKEIDFLKLYNRLNSRAYRLFSSPSTYLSILTIGGAVGFHISISEGCQSLLALPYIVGLSINLYKNTLPSCKETHLIKKIKQTSEYKECVSLYDDYTTKIAELLQSLHIHNIFDTCNLLNTLMNVGLFSENFYYSYHDYQNELFPINELSGARISTGHGVCRHEAVFTTNILTKMGYKASKITVRNTSQITDSLEELNIKEQDGNESVWNHAVVGIQENDEKILFDATAGKFAGRIPTLNVLSKQCALLYPQINDKYVLIKPNQTTFKGMGNIDIDKFMNLPLRELKNKDLDHSLYDTNILFNENLDLFAKFQKENIEQVERIAKLEKKIVPYSDDEIVSWKVK